MTFQAIESTAFQAAEGSGYQAFLKYGIWMVESGIGKKVPYETDYETAISPTGSTQTELASQSGLALNRTTRQVAWVYTLFGSSNRKVIFTSYNYQNSADVYDNSDSDIGNYVALDAANQYVYFTKQSTADLWRVDNNGSNAQKIATRADGVQLPHVHRGDNRIYWIENTGSGTSIYRCDSDGTNVTQVLTQATAAVTPSIADITSEPNNDRIYYNWLDNTGNQQIRRVNTDGTGDTFIRTAIGTGGNSRLTIDTINDKLYWQLTAGTVSRSNLDGSNIETLQQLNANDFEAL